MELNYKQSTVQIMILIHGEEEGFKRGLRDIDKSGRDAMMLQETQKLPIRHETPKPLTSHNAQNMPFHLGHPVLTHLLDRRLANSKQAG